MAVRFRLLYTSNATRIENEADDDISFPLLLFEWGEREKEGGSCKPLVFRICVNDEYTQAAGSPRTQEREREREREKT